MFPRYFGEEIPTGCDPRYFIGDTLIRIEDSLQRQLREALLFRDGDAVSQEEIESHVNEISETFLAKLPELHKTLLKDVQAAFDGDPAAAKQRGDHLFVSGVLRGVCIPHCP